MAATVQLALGGLVLKAAWKCHYPFVAGVPPVKHEAHKMPLGQVGFKANEKQELRLSFLAPGRMRVFAACTWHTAAVLSGVSGPSGSAQQ